MAFGPIRDTPLGKALSWSDAGRLDGRAVAIAILGMTVPVLAGLATGRPDIGFTIGLGAMLLTDRLAATAMGAAIVVAANLILDLMLRTTTAAASKKSV